MSIVKQKYTYFVMAAPPRRKKNKKESELSKKVAVDIPGVLKKYTTLHRRCPTLKLGMLTKYV